MRLRGLNIALVGCARYLDTSGLGPEIDSADFVIRTNWTLPIRPAFYPHVGSRTDLVYWCRSCFAERDAAEKASVPAERLDTRYRKKLTVRLVGEAMAEEYRPNSGVVKLFDLLDTSECASVRVYGFDFYATGWTQAEAKARDGVPGASKAAAKRNTFPPHTWRHDPAVDRMILKDLLAREPRFIPDATLRGILEQTGTS